MADSLFSRSGSATIDDGTAPAAGTDALFTRSGSAVPPKPNAAPSTTGYNNPTAAPQYIGGAATAAGAATTRKQTPLGILGGRIDLPYIVGNASGLGKTQAERQANTKKAFSLWMNDPEEANRQYGLGSATQMKAEAAQGNPISAWFLKHPAATAAATYAGEALNPVGGVGPDIVKGGVGLLRETPVAPLISATEKVANTAGSHIAGLFGDRYAALRRAMGVGTQNAAEAEVGARNVLSARAAGKVTAQEHVNSLFNDQTINQKKHIVRVYQGTEKAATPDIAARAHQLGDVIESTDLQQLEHPGLLTTSKQFKAAPYFPMKNAYESPTANAPEVQALLDKAAEDKPFSGMYGRGIRKGTAGRTGNYRRTIATLSDSEASGKLAQDFDPAVALQNHLSERLGNVNYENALQALPASVRRDVQYFTRSGQAFNPVDETGKAISDPTALKAAADYENLRVLREVKGKPLPYYQPSLVKDVPQPGPLDAATRRTPASVPDPPVDPGLPFNTPGQMGLHVGQYGNDALTPRGPAQLGLFTAPGTASSVRSGFREAESVPATTRLDPLTGDVAKYRGSLAAQQQALRLATVAPDVLKGAERDAGDLFVPKAAGGGPLYGKPLEKALAKLDKSKNASILKKSSDAILPDYEVAGKTVKGFVPASEQLRSLGSPTLQYSTLHSDFAKVLDNAMGASAKASDKSGVAGMFHAFNALSRVGVIANLFVHPGWNLTRQYLGAGGDFGTVGRIWMKTLGAVGEGLTKGGITESELPSSIAGRVSEAAGMVAQPAIGGKLAMGDDATRLMTSPTSELMSMAPSRAVGALRVANKGVTRLWNSNSKIVFGVAEREFAKATHELLQTKGMSPERAAIAVRRMYGDSGSLDPTSSLANFMKSSTFFYPWLRAIVPFWLKTSLTNPNAINAPYEAARRNNEVIGDPMEDDPVNPTGDFTIALGKDNAGGMRYFAMPNPAKTADDLATGVSSLAHGDISGGLYAGQRILAGHFNPLYSAALNTATTLKAPAKDPDLPQNYQTVFNRAAPGGVQARQIGQYAGRMASGALPFASQIQGLPQWARDVAQTPAGLPTAETLLGATGGAYVSRDPETTKAGVGKLWSKIAKEVGRIQYSNLPDAQKQALISTLYDSYVQVRDSMGAKRR